MSIKEQLTQAAAAARVGELAEARVLYDKITHQAPNNPQGWLGLAGVLTDPNEKQTALQKALVVDPGNAEAQAGLALLAKRQQIKVSGDNPVVWYGAGPEPQPIAPPAARGEPEKLVEGPAAGNVPVAVAPASQTLYCYRHPDRATMLRCNKCNRPICTDCAIRTPVGFRCVECVNQQRSSYYSAAGSDPLLIGGVIFVISAILGVVLNVIPSFGLFGILIAAFVGPALGGGLAELARRVVGRRRGRNNSLVGTSAFVIGMIAGVALPLVAQALLGGNLTRALLAPLALFARLDILALIVFGAATVYARLR